MPGAGGVHDLDLEDPAITDLEPLTDVGRDPGVGSSEHVARPARHVGVEVVERDHLVAIDQPAERVGTGGRLATNDRAQRVGTLDCDPAVVDAASLVGEQHAVGVMAHQRVEIRRGDLDHVLVARPVHRSFAITSSA